MNSAASRSVVAALRRVRGTVAKGAIVSVMVMFSSKRKPLSVLRRGALFSLYQLADRIGGDGQRDLAAVRRAARQGFGEVQRLLGLDLWRHGRFVRIDGCLDEDRAGCRQRLLDDAAAFFWPLDREAGRAAGARHHREIDRLQTADVFRIAQE